MKQKLIYINDYAFSDSVMSEIVGRKYPRHHLWGGDILAEEYDVEIARLRKIRIGNDKLKLLFQNICLFFRYWRGAVIYSALPNYSLLFLLAKKLRIRKYKIISIVHHPTSRLYMAEEYDRLVFISDEVRSRYGDTVKNKSEYVFWGGDLDFYDYNSKTAGVEYDFISIGKTLRDYSLYERAMGCMGARFLSVGAKDSRINEVSYVKAVELYDKSRFAVIPVIPFNGASPVLSGLTSFIDAVSLGKPVLMSDNTLIGIDIQKEGLGLMYEAGNMDDFVRKAERLYRLSDNEYSEMKNNCLRFAMRHDYRRFCHKVLEIVKSL